MRKSEIEEVLLREVAEAHGWTLDDVARYSGEKYPTVRGIWYKQVRNPNLETALNIARALGVPVESLVKYREIEGGETSEDIETPALAGVMAFA